MYQCNSVTVYQRKIFDIQVYKCTLTDMTSDSPLREKTYKFASQVVILCKKIQEDQREYILTKQLIKSATSVGANLEEAQQAESRKDFISKISISIKEAYESRYWLRLLRDAKYAETSELEKLLSDIQEIIVIFGASINTAKKNLNKTCVDS